MEDVEGYCLNLVPPAGQDWLDYPLSERILSRLRADLSCVEWSKEEQSENAEGGTELWVCPTDDCTYVTIDRNEEGRLTFLQVGVSRTGDHEWTSRLAVSVLRLISHFQLGTEA